MNEDGWFWMPVIVLGILSFVIAKLVCHCWGWACWMTEVSDGIMVVIK